MILNPYSHTSAGGGLSVSPDHWWDLDDDGTWADSVGSVDLSTETGTVTVTSSGGPDSQDVLTTASGADNFTRSTSACHADFQNTLSVSCWFRPEDLANTGYYHTFGFAAFCTSYQSNQGVRVLMKVPGSSNEIYVSSRGTNFETGVNASDDTWYHVVYTLNGGTDPTVYVDNTKYTFSGSSLYVRPLNGTIAAGNGAAAFGRAQLGGKLAMVGVWDGAAITDDDVSYLYNSGNGRQYGDL